MIVFLPLMPKGVEHMLGWLAIEESEWCSFR